MVIMGERKPFLAGKVLFTGIFLLTVQLVSCNEQKWDHFIMVQVWPPGTCADAPEEHHTCHIDKGVKTWTIHGLWPTLGEEKRPTYCNESWKFDETKIKSLEDQLDVYWPNIYNDTPRTGLWEHEWFEHGTCCTDLASTAGEFNYFMAGLKLNKQYDLLQILSNAGVTPSETAQYGYTDFVNAVKKVTGFEPDVLCTTKKQQTGETYHLIDEIRICLNKDFSPRSCTDADGPNYARGLYFFTGKHSLGDFEKGEKKGFIGSRLTYHKNGSFCPRHKKFYYPPIHAVK